MNTSPAAVSPDERPTVRLYRAALGPVHTDHYLAAFARFDERGRAGPVWNLWAFVFHLGWLIYRQLWGAAGEFAALLGAWALVSGGLWWLADALPVGVRVGLVLTLLLLVLLVPGLFGTALLHAQVRRRMIAAVERSPTVDAACEALQAQAGEQRMKGVRGAIALLAAVLLGVAGGWTWHSAPERDAAPAVALPPMVPGAPQPALGEMAPTEGASSPGPGPAADEALPAISLPVVPAVPQPAPGERATTAEVRPSPGPGAAADEAPPQAPAPIATEPVTGPTATPVPAAILRPRERGFGVSVGLFAVESNAQRAAAALTAAGLPVLSDPIESARGPMTRVRVGPFETRAQADSAADRVRSLGLEARVYQP